ncbi:hypothetical protein BC937DRAFT_92871, partial [Endogone sp. FLAS-F59071]
DEVEDPGLTEEQRQELYNAIDYDEEKAAIETAVDFPKDTMMLSLRTKLKKGSFSLKQSPHDRNLEILSLIFDTVTTNLIQYPDGMKLTAGLGDLSLYDGTTPNTLFPQLIRVKEVDIDAVEEEQEAIVANSNAKSKLRESDDLLESAPKEATAGEEGGEDSRADKDDDRTVVETEEPLDPKELNPFFQLELEHKPLDDRADNGVTLKMRHLEIIYNAEAVNTVIKFFTPPDLEMESEVAGDTFEGFKQQTRAGLEYALEQHTTLDMKIDMDAPIIVIPESCTRKKALVLVLDAGHINVESNLVPKEAIAEVKAKQRQQYSDEDYVRLESLMYDRFTMQLTATKALVGESVEQCLAEVRSTTPRSDLNIVDRIDMSFLLESSILPKAPNLTRFKVSGQLPLLSINFSDRKYKTIMKIIDLVIPKNPEEEDGEGDVEEIEGLVATNDVKTMMSKSKRKSTQSLFLLGNAGGNDLPKTNASKRITWRNRSPEEVLIDSEDDAESVRDEGVGDGDSVKEIEVDRESIAESEDSRSVRTVSAKKKGSKKLKVSQKLFEFSFHVSKVSAGLRQAHSDINQPERLLCDLVLQHFALQFTQRPYDMSLNVRLKSLNVEDRMEHGSEFKYLVTSESVYENVSQLHKKDLVEFNFVMVNQNSPEYFTKYEAIDQTIDLTLSTLNLIVTRSSILTLYNFILTTFVPSENTAASTTSAQKSVVTQDVAPAQDEEVQKDTTSKVTTQPKNPLTLQVKVCLDSVNLILNNDGVRLATGRLSHGDVSVMLRQNQITVSAKLGNFSLTDDLSKSTSTQSLRQLLTIEGDELADFRFETYNPYKIDYPGYDQLIYLRIGSARFTFLEEPVRQLVAYATKFAEMKALYDRASQAAMNSAAQLQGAVMKLHFDIMVKTPVVVFPGHKNSKDMVIANLGEISASNKFVPSNLELGGEEVNQMKAAIRQIRVMSKFSFPDLPQQELPIVDDVDLEFDIEYAGHTEGSARPATEVKGSLSDVQINLTEKQYKFLINLANAVSGAFGGSGDRAEEEIAVDEQIPIPSSGADTVNIFAAGNLPSSSTQADSNEAKVYTSLELVFGMPTVALEIYRGDGAQKALEEISLSKVSLNQTNLKFKMLSEGTMETELKIDSLTLNDSRTDVKTRYREIIPAVSNGGPQFQVKLDISAPTPDRNIIAVVTVDSPKVIFSLDFVFMLQYFFMTPFVPDAKAAEIAAASAKKTAISTIKTKKRKSVAPQQQPQGKLTLSFRVNIVYAEIILLANPAISSSEAVILSAQQVMLSQQGIMALAVDKIGMFLCRMDKREETTLRFIETFDIAMTMDNRSTAPGHQITNITIDVRPLILRLSYRDVMLILDIVNKAVELSHGPAPLPMPANTPTNPQAKSRKRGLSVSGASAAVGGAAASLMTNFNSSFDPYIILKATFQGMRLILIEDIHELPMIDMSANQFNVDVSDWSSEVYVLLPMYNITNILVCTLSHNISEFKHWQLHVDTKISTYINFFNIKNSHWEPLLEPWQFNVKVSRNSVSEGIAVDLSSRTRLEINITHSFIETALSILDTFDRQKNVVLHSARGSVSPYTVRNRTGYNIHVWNVAEDSTDTVIQNMSDGADLPWWFDDWRSRRESMYVTKNMLGLQIDGPGWESLKDIPVDREGATIYILRPKVKNVSHRLVVDVKLQDNVKVVTFRSSMVVENRTLLPVDVVMVDQQGNTASPISKIAPGEDFAVPIEMAYHNLIRVRPDAGFGYNWSDQNLFWSDIVRGNKMRSVSCKSIDQGPSFKFQVYGRYDKKDPMARNYPCMAIRLSAPIEIENLLPYDFTYQIIDKDTNQNVETFLRKGGTSPLHVVEIGHLILMNVTIQDTDYRPSEYAIISTHNPDDYSLDEALSVVDPDGNKLHLRINILEVPESGGAHKFSIYSPYVMINKTGLDMSFKSKPFLGSAKLTAGQNFPRHRDQKVEPYMFSYPKQDNRNRALIKVGGSEWSKPLTFEAIGSFQAVSMPSLTRPEEIYIGASVQEGKGKYKLTKIITFTPRFILKNNLNEDISFREPASTNNTLLKAGQRAPLHFLRQGVEKQLTVQFPGLNNPWSAPFNIQEVGKVHIKVEKGDTVRILLRIDILLEGATLFLVFHKEEGTWPYRIDNESDVDVTIFQQDPMVTSQEYPGNISSVASLSRVKKYKLAAGERMPYAWDYPAIKDKILILLINGHSRVINIKEIGSQVPFSYPTAAGRGILSIDVVAEGPTQVLKLSNFKQSESMFRPRSASISSASSSRESSSRDGFEVIDVHSVINFTFEIRLAGFGISIVNKRMQELAYTSVRDLDLKFTDSTMYQSVRAVVKWLQIDNQLFGTIYPLLLYPSVILKDGKEQDVHPTFSIALDRVKDDSHGVLYLKYFSVLLQEMTFEMDEDFLFAALEFAKMNVPGWDDQTSGLLVDESIEIPEPKTSEGEAQLYFEVFNIQPMKLNISFVRTEHVNVVDERPSGSSPITFFLNILTMALGNINDAPIKLNALAIENVRVSGPEFLGRIQRHYSEQFLYQIHNILGSADFLGNPVGLFNNLSSGVQELFYEPYQGIIMSDRPQDLGIGIARGVGGFVKKSVFGFSDSFAKVTGSIGKGLSAATLDKAYQDRRRLNMARNKPKHAIYGVTQGATSLGDSIASGVAGLFTRPMEEVEKDGIGGLFSGFGKGVVGLVTKPVVGVFDLASNVTEGIRNTTMVFDANDIDRVRSPRYVGRDGILRPYSQREALGQAWLKDLGNGKYFNDDYVAHCSVQGDEVVAMLTYSRIMLVRTKRLTVDWEQPFPEIQTIKCESSGIAILLRGGIPGPFILIREKSSREWFFKMIEEAVIRFNAEKRPID